MNVSRQKSIIFRKIVSVELFYFIDKFTPVMRDETLI